jgi:hypothetical protein
MLLFNWRPYFTNLQILKIQFTKLTKSELVIVKFAHF